MEEAADALIETTTKLAKVCLEDVQSKHRKERKELQAKIQELKKNAPKSDKKKRKEVLEEIAKLEANLEVRHAEELKKVEAEVNANEKPASDDTQEETTKNNHNNVSDNDENDVVHTKQPQRVSKAQKRREKKSREARRREEDIKAAAQDIYSPKAVEYRKLVAKLKSRQLALHNIPSDGDCLFNAVRHQLMQQGLGTHNVQELRTETANYIRANKDALIPYMTNPGTGDLLTDEEFEVYCEEVRNTPAWGGQIELKALTSILKVPIEVLQADGSPTIQGADEFGGSPLVITYHRHMYSLGEHYNSTVELVQEGSEDEQQDDI
ncbi:deubiquitinase OTUD6B [Stomoxys calcitrans]|uniref:deubiquitinase OTUD6B n=1 Tax=Stomoxys calcitrans TaxID=35570 RepID=UPI0027E2BC62|nr:deubiquitinase OTUD6B [Stomoxys calcitrans]